MPKSETKKNTNGGLVKSTGRLDTGIAPCGHVKKGKE